MQSWSRQSPRLCNSSIIVKSHQHLFVFCDGADQKDRAACPHPFDFEYKPAPGEALNSLESGRLLLDDRLGRGVKSVSARIVNTAKDNLSKVEGTSELKHKTTLPVKLIPDGRQPGRWTGKPSITSSWMVGGIWTCEKNVYVLEIA